MSIAIHLDFVRRAGTTRAQAVLCRLRKDASQDPRRIAMFTRQAAELDRRAARLDAEAARARENS